MTRNVIFAAPADDPRARRTADVVVVIIASIVVLSGLRAHMVGTDLDSRVTEFFAQGYPGWISAIFTIVFILGGLYAFGLFAAIGLYRHGRGPIFRDMFFAGVVSAGASIGVSLWAGEWPDIFPELLERDGVPSYPMLRLTVSIAVVTVAAPYLALPMRRVGRRLMFAMLIAALVMGYGSLVTVLGGAALGWGSAAVVHLIFGSAVGIPSKARIGDALRTIRLRPVDLEFLEVQPVGASLLRGRVEIGDGGGDVDGTADRTADVMVDVMVKVYGRDAADAALAARTWRSVWYRTDGRALSASAMQQVEHEALMLLEGARNDAPVPELTGWGRGDAGDAVIVTRWLEGRRLLALDADAVTDEILANCWDGVARLRAAGLAHNAIDRLLIAVDDDGSVTLDGLQSAVFTPDERALATDVAQMFVATTIAVGAERAIAAARSGIGDEELFAALTLVQANALTSSLQKDVRAAKLKLKDLRNATAEAIGAPSPELVQLERVTWGGVAMLVLTVFAMYALIGSLSDIGFDTIVDELSNADWTWVIVAFTLAQLTNIGEYITLTGMVPGRVPFGPTIIFRYALSFISLAVPSDAGAIAMNIRYMRKLGVSAPAAIAQGPLITIISKTFDVILLLITLRIVGQEIDVDDVDGGPAFRLIVLVIVLFVAGVVVIAAVPSLRRRVIPPIKEGLLAVKESITDPERLLRVAGGTLAQRLLFALALSAVVSAYGAHISFSEAIFVNSIVSLFVGLMPVPGGIGVGEAALAAGLAAVGVPEGAAFAAALTHRMSTSYIPPVLGWFGTRWLTARDYL